MKRFEVYWVTARPNGRQRNSKNTAVLIISPDEMNRLLGTVIVAPMRHGNPKLSLSCDVSVSR